MKTIKQHYPLIRTIYLYLFALLGLVLLVIGTIRFVDMGLKAFVFTKAEEERRLFNKQPPMPYQIERIKQIEKVQGDEGLSEEEKVIIRQWLTDYKNWQERSSKIDPVVTRRHRDASINLSMILVGLPLYLYHWRIIRRETKKNS
jgi:hypothetical protein